MQKQVKSKSGTVIRKSGDKTIVVEVMRFVKDATYGKYLRRRKKFHVHDEKNICQLGDKVAIVETKPISRTKRWKISSVVSHGMYIAKGADDTVTKKSVEV